MAIKLEKNYSSTILSIVTGSLFLFLIFNNKILIHFCLSIGLLSLISPYISMKIDFVWNQITWLLSLIIPTILLTVIFFFILTPIAFLSKLFGKKNMLQIKNTSDSLFINSNKEFNSKSFEKPW